MFFLRLTYLTIAITINVIEIITAEIINPEQSKMTSDNAPYLPGTNNWMYSVNAAIPQPKTILTGIEKNNFLSLKNKDQVSVEKIPRTRNAPKWPIPFLTLYKKVEISLISSCFNTLNFSSTT